MAKYQRSGIGNGIENENKQIINVENKRKQAKASVANNGSSNSEESEKRKKSAASWRHHGSNNGSISNIVTKIIIGRNNQYLAASA